MTLSRLRSEPLKSELKRFVPFEEEAKRLEARLDALDLLEAKEQILMPLRIVDSEALLFRLAKLVVES